MKRYLYQMLTHAYGPALTTSNQHKVIRRDSNQIESTKGFYEVTHAYGEVPAKTEPIEGLSREALAYTRRRPVLTKIKPTKGTIRCFFLHAYIASFD